jgi:hypothetical protein
MALISNFYTRLGLENLMERCRKISARDGYYKRQEYDVIGCSNSLKVLQVSRRFSIVRIHSTLLEIMYCME